MSLILRFLRFNPISKFLFSIKWTDYILRRFFIRKLYDEKKFLNTSKNIVNINNELNPILEKYRGCLGHGVALSLIRDNKLPSYQDLDYDIFDCTRINELTDDMYALGYVCVFKGFLNNEIKQLIFTKDNYHIDFFMCNEVDNKFDVATFTCEKIFEKRYIKNKEVYSDDYLCYVRKMTSCFIDKKIINNNVFFLPKQFDTYFSEMYGSDWRKQKKYFNWSLNPKTNLPIKHKKNVYVIIADDKNL